MNVVPYAPVFNPMPVLDRLMQVARQNPNAVAHVERLARQYGPLAMAHVRQFLDHAGYRVGRAVRDWVGRHVRPRRNQFMHNVRTGLAEQQRVRALRDGHRTVRRYLQYKAPARAIRSVVQSNSAQVRGSRGMAGRPRGGQSRRRGGGRLRVRRPLRWGGRPMKRPELKAYDLTTTNDVSSTITLIQVPVRDITLGVNSNQRVGRKVLVKSLLIAGKLYINGASNNDNVNDSVWVWVVIDRQSNNADAAVADVWSTATASRALRNLDQGPRFKIVKCFEVKIQPVAVGSHINQPFEEYIPLNTVVSWHGTANMGPTKNNILIFCGNSNSLSTSMKIEYATRVRYVDI